MAFERKVLAQSTPAVTPTLTDVYTVPTGATAVISSIVVCNRDSAEHTFRLSVAKNGAADTIAQYLAYDMPVPANDSVFVQVGITLDGDDVIRACVDAAQVSVNVFGQEET